MKNKLSYILLVSLLVAGSSAFAMMEGEGVLGEGRSFNAHRSKVVEALETGKPIEIGGHHYKVTGTIVGTAGEMFKTDSDPMVHLYNGWTYNKTPTSWQYLLDLPPQFDENGIPIPGTGGDGVANIEITKID